MAVVRQLLDRRGRRSALAAVVATALGLAVGELLTALIPSTASPFVAVGNQLIDLTPRAVKDWAVEQFGTADKPVLLGGIAFGLLVATIVVGLVAGEHPRLGVAMFLGVGLIGAVTAVLDRVRLGALSQRESWWRPRPWPSACWPSCSFYGWHADPSSRRCTRRRRRSSRATVERPDGTVEPFDRRAFLLTASALGVAAVAGGAVAQVVSRSATGAAITLPRPADPAKAIPAGTALKVPGITSYVTPNDDVLPRRHRAAGPARSTVADWQLRIHGMVDNELTLLLRRPARPAARRAPHHADLRLQRGRRPVRRQRPLARRPDRATCSPRPACRTAPTR